jgi:hypothetical protein
MEQRSPVLRAGRRVFSESLRDERREVPRHIGANGVNGRGRGHSMLTRKLQKVVRLERQTACQHLKEDHAERVDIGGRSNRCFAGCLLGRHVSRCPQESTRSRHRRLAARTGYTEVGQLRVPMLVEDDV